MPITQTTPTGPVTGPITVADAADVTQGALADAAVDTDTTGTFSGKLRGLVKLFVNLLSRVPAALGAGGGIKVDGSGTALPVSGTVTASGPLTDAQLRATPVPVSGTVTASGPLTDAQLRASAVPVTANAGTNLNTSALALEAGGNLAGAAASLAVIDDWDETDRAKVNLIAGQAGITAGAGAVAASTPRITHASDDPVTTALQIMDDWDETDRAKVNPIAGQAGVQGASGAVSANTQRVVLATDVALPTGANVLGQVTANAGTNLNTAALALDATLAAGGTNKTLKRIVVALAATGDVIALVASKRLKVYQYALQSRNDSMTCQLRDGAAGAMMGLRWTLNAREGASGGGGRRGEISLWHYGGKRASGCDLRLGHNRHRVFLLG